MNFRTPESSKKSWPHANWVSWVTWPLKNCHHTPGAAWQVCIGSDSFYLQYSNRVNLFDYLNIYTVTIVIYALIKDYILLIVHRSNNHQNCHNQYIDLCLLTNNETLYFPNDPFTYKRYAVCKVFSLKMRYGPQIDNRIAKGQQRFHHDNNCNCKW